ncbi:hypothetical protein [Aerosticca soli]|jgi:hypothetical protein|uniref:Transmembrane protein n=1 Tax=Aerosticca soli TaxID=2010829 RepID=A0A2Z6E5A6_9GAMM|nr:hypothetical protein [Aerosticca soli]MDI3261605.1 hypothetical protein [Fulvimonas sp.]BBD79931.1 hypothetical protein ALSL_1273 [Aerosticca soli]
MSTRLLAGIVLGFPLAGGLLALALGLLPGHGQAWLLPMLWLFFPLWWTILCVSLMFARGLKAWLALGAANVLVFAVLTGLRHLGG